MSVQTTASRPAGKSAGAAGVGVILTLVIFVVVFVTFLVAPLIALFLAYLGFTVMRPRPSRTESSGPSGQPVQSASGFGAGAQ